MLPVTMNGHLVGIVTKADLLHLITSENPIKTIMSTNIIVAKLDDRVIHARRLMMNNNIARLPVIDHGMVVGIISDKEIAFAFAELRKNVSLGQQQNRLKNLLVRDVMETNAITVTDSDTIKECAHLMNEEDIGCLPIVGNDNKIRGMVTRTDILKHFAKDLEKR
jgi:CBS domain-containing protein